MKNKLKKVNKKSLVKKSKIVVGIRYLSEPHFVEFDKMENAKEFINDLSCRIDFVHTIINEKRNTAATPRGRKKD